MRLRNKFFTCVFLFCSMLSSFQPIKSIGNEDGDFPKINIVLAEEQSITLEQDKSGNLFLEVPQSFVEEQKDFNAMPSHYKQMQSDKLFREAEQKASEMVVNSELARIQHKYFTGSDDFDDQAKRDLAAGAALGAAAGVAAELAASFFAISAEVAAAGSVAATVAAPTAPVGGPVLIGLLAGGSVVVLRAIAKQRNNTFENQEKDQVIERAYFPTELTTEQLYGNSPQKYREINPSSIIEKSNDDGSTRYLIPIDKSDLSGEVVAYYIPNMQGPLVNKSEYFPVQSDQTPSVAGNENGKNINVPDLVTRLGKILTQFKNDSFKMVDTDAGAINFLDTERGDGVIAVPGDVSFENAMDVDFVNTGIQEKEKILIDFSSLPSAPTILSGIQENVGFGVSIDSKVRMLDAMGDKDFGFTINFNSKQKSIDGLANNPIFEAKLIDRKYRNSLTTVGQYRGYLLGENIYDSNVVYAFEYWEQPIFLELIKTDFPKKYKETIVYLYKNSEQLKKYLDKYKHIGGLKTKRAGMFSFFGQGSSDDTHAGRDFVYHEYDLLMKNEYPLMYLKEKLFEESGSKHYKFDESGFLEVAGGLISCWESLSVKDQEVLDAILSIALENSKIQQGGKQKVLELRNMVVDKAFNKLSSEDKNLMLDDPLQWLENICDGKNKVNVDFNDFAKTLQENVVAVLQNQMGELSDTKKQRLFEILFNLQKNIVFSDDLSEQIKRAYYKFQALDKHQKEVKQQVLEYNNSVQSMQKELKSKYFNKEAFMQYEEVSLERARKGELSLSDLQSLYDMISKVSQCSRPFDKNEIIKFRDAELETRKILTAAIVTSFNEKGINSLTEQQKIRYAVWKKHQDESRKKEVTTQGQQKGEKRQQRFNLFQKEGFAMGSPWSSQSSNLNPEIASQMAKVSGVSPSNIFGKNKSKQVDGIVQQERFSTSQKVGLGFATGCQWSSQSSNLNPEIASQMAKAFGVNPSNVFGKDKHVVIPEKVIPEGIIQEEVVPPVIEEEIVPEVVVPVEVIQEEVISEEVIREEVVSPVIEEEIIQEEVIQEEIVKEEVIQEKDEEKGKQESFGDSTVKQVEKIVGQVGWNVGVESLAQTAGVLCQRAGNRFFSNGDDILPVDPFRDCKMPFDGGQVYDPIASQIASPFDQCISPFSSVRNPFGGVDSGRESSLLSRIKKESPRPSRFNSGNVRPKQKRKFKDLISTNTNPSSEEKPSVKPVVKETPSEQTETGQPDPEPPNKKPKKDDDKNDEDFGKGDQGDAQKASSQEETTKKLLEESDSLGESRKHFNMYEKNGGYQQVLKDFDSLGLKNIKKVSDNMIRGQLKDGSWVNIHKSTRDGMHRWTLGFGNNKIRYN